MNNAVILPDNSTDPRRFERVANPPRIEAEALVWSATGPKQDTTARLLSTIYVAGCQMHLEAFAVDVVSDEQAFVKLPADAEYHFGEEESALYTFNNQALETIAINGRDYVLVAYPSGD